MRTHYLLYCTKFVTCEERRVLNHQADNPTLQIAQGSLLKIQSHDQTRLDSLLMSQQGEYPEEAWLQSIIEAKSALFRVDALSVAFQKAGIQVWLAPFDQLAKIRWAHAKWMVSEKVIKGQDLRKTMAAKSRIGRPIGQVTPPEIKQRNKVVTPKELELLYEQRSDVQLDLQSAKQYRHFFITAYRQLRSQAVLRKRALRLLAGLAFVHVPGYQVVQTAKRRHRAASQTILDTLVYRLNMMIVRDPNKSSRLNPS